MHFESVAVFVVTPGSGGQMPTMKTKSCMRNFRDALRAEAKSESSAAVPQAIVIYSNPPFNIGETRQRAFSASSSEHQSHAPANLGRGLLTSALSIPLSNVKRHSPSMPRLHIFPTSLVIEPSRTEAGRSLWIDREKCTIEANDRPIGDLEKAQTQFIDGVAGIVKCALLNDPTS